jgi:rhamnosyltransferase
MTSDSEISAARIPRGDAMTVVVLYQPEEADLTNLSLLAQSGGSVIAVVNSISSSQRAMLPDIEGLTVIHNDRNLGLAYALNQGLGAAMAAGARYVLMLDQDSRPPQGMLDRMAAAAGAIERSGRRLGCASPVLRDRKVAAIGNAPNADLVATETLATSGTLITRAGWEEVGPMWEDLFIDGIDHEWCFRAQSLGFETVVLPEIVMEHDMGELAVNLFGRFRPIHRSPIRHYFIVRNTLWLARRRYIPLSWRLREVGKLAYRSPIYLLVSSDRLRSAANIVRALVDGLFQTNVRQPV